MRNMVNTLAALLIVLGAATTTDASVVSNDPAVCKIVSLDNDKKYRLIYQAEESEKVNIQLFNSADQLIHSETVYGDGFVKTFNLALVPQGDYKFVVSTDKEVLSEVVSLGSSVWNANLVLSSQEDGKYALVGNNNSGEEVEYTIVDDQGNELYHASVAPHADVKLLFNLKEVEGAQVTFLFYNQDELLKEAIVKL